MASLTLVIGPITATKTTGNATAQAILDDFIKARSDAQGGPAGATAQEKADWVLNQLIFFLRSTANEYNVRVQRDAAEIAIRTRDWA